MKRKNQISSRFKAFKCLLMLALLALCVRAEAIDLEFQDSFGLGAVATASVAPDCLDYCIKGVCVWLVCTIYECHLEYTAWIEHKLPDLVVTAYNEPGKTPWDEARGAYGGLAVAELESVMGGLFGFPIVGGGGRTYLNQTANADDENTTASAMRFKEAQAIGNPFVNAISRFVQDYMCESDTNEFQPYFMSEIDAFTWRTGIPELLYPQSWVPGLRELSAGPGFVGLFQTWGSIYPRQGFLMNRDDMSAAGVMATRAVDVASKSSQPHVYLRADLEPHDEHDENWLMVYPKQETECIAFGDPLYPEGRQAPYGGYGWVYWGTHDCCVPAPGVLLAKIELNDCG